MVSALWKAAADGDLNYLKELLKDASQVDIEVKDHTGVTPLIQAVRNGHLEVVKELLARGADPNNASSQGKPETYTQDPAILELLKAGGSQPTVNGHVQPPHTGTPGAPEAHSPDGGHHYEQNGAPPAPYPQPMPGYWYMPHGGAYPPYPYMPPPPAEGMPPQQHPMQGYYPVPPHHPQGPPPQPSQDGASPQDAGHQQQNGSPTMHIPPDVARTIPCRYFPMCKYGASCMFLHPAAPYYNVPAPPVPYSGYDAMNHPPSYAPHGYYGVPPPPPQSFPPPPPPPAAHATGGPQSPVQHTGGAPPPPLAVPFPADGSVPPPPPPGAYPYPPPQIATPQSMPPPVTISPTAPYHPAPVVIPVQPPVPTYSSPVSPTLHRKESGSAINYPQQPPPAPAVVPPAPQANGFVETPVNGKPAPNFGAGEAEGRPHFQSNNGYRRGGFRKTSFNGPARPPCLFFPAGKCKNGSECRFPHVRPEDDPAAFGPEGYPPQSFPQRNTRPQNHMRGGHGPRSFGPREDAPNGDANGQPRPHMTNGFRKHYPGSDFAGRGGFHNGGFRGGKFGGGGPGHHVPPVSQKEKVLSPADFPSLNGASTPPATNGHVNGNGLTAAQVLKRNAPQTPAIKELAHEEALADAMAKVTLNGHAKENGIKAPSRSESPDLPPPVFASINDTVTSAAKLVAAA